MDQKDKHVLCGYGLANGLIKERLRLRSALAKGLSFLELPVDRVLQLKIGKESFRHLHQDD